MICDSAIERHEARLPFSPILPRAAWASKRLEVRCVPTTTPTVLDTSMREATSDLAIGSHGPDSRTGRSGRWRGAPLRYRR